MTIFFSEALPSTDALTEAELLGIYNGLDTCMTSEIFEEIKGQLGGPYAEVDVLPGLHGCKAKIYAFAKELQGPIFDMVTRGVRVDRKVVRKKLAWLEREQERYNGWLQRVAKEIWGQELNPESPAQLNKILYKVLGLPEQTSRVGREWKVSTNRDALEKLEMYPTAAVLVKLILALKDINGKIETLGRGIDNDGRLRNSYNIAGTVSGRLSSSKSIFRTGGNTQNYTDELRDIFIPDRGMKFAYVDLSQAESRAVGLMAKLVTGKDGYLRACESGDLHSTVAKLVWPELEWTGNAGEDRKIADQIFYRHFSYRDLSKRGGHLCLTGDHEVLTPEGWVPISKMPPVIQAWEPLPNGTYKAEFQSVSTWHSYEEAYALIEWKSDRLHSYMTEKHRMPHVEFPFDGVQELIATRQPTGFIPIGDGTFVNGNAIKVKRHCLNGKPVSVYCPTLKAGWFYVRRYGKVFVTGNSNYNGNEYVAAIALKIQQSIARQFQAGYFCAFPEIRDWQDWTKQELKDRGVLVTPFGRIRQFFGRKTEHSVINEAISFAPQSLVADMLNDGMLRFWWECMRGLPAELIFQVHDAILFQYEMEHEEKVLGRAQAALEKPLEGTDFSIPADVAVGWNFAKEGKDNPFGMKKWKGKDERKPPAWVLPKSEASAAEVEEFLNSPVFGG